MAKIKDLNEELAGYIKAYAEAYTWLEDETVAYQRDDALAALDLAEGMLANYLLRTGPLTYQKFTPHPSKDKKPNFIGQIDAID